MKRTLVVICLLSASFLLGACKHRHKKCCGAKAPLSAYPVAASPVGYK